MKHTMWSLLAIAFALAAAPGPADIRSPVIASRGRLDPSVLGHVVYSFEVDADGLPKDAFEPPPRDIDVIYRDLHTGNLEIERSVAADWFAVFDEPRYGRAFMSATAHGGGTILCTMEVSYRGTSGWIFHDQGPRRCQIFEKLLRR